MTSCEPFRSSAYQDDLRWRIVWQREGLGLSCQEIAGNLNIDRSTVHRTIFLFRNTGNVRKQSLHPNGACKLSDPAQLLILQLIVERPGIYLREIRKELRDFMGIEVQESTICKYLQKNCITRQKMRTIALQRDVFLRQQFINDVSVYNSDMFIFLDETGADRRNSIRKYGYSIRGKRPINHRLLVRGKRVSGLALISINGLLDVKIQNENTNADSFYDFVQEYVLPHLQPFNGQNSHSVMIMDNCAIHHTKPIASMIQEVGSLVHYLPPYSPDLNPIESAFSKVKLELQQLEEDPTADIEMLLLQAFTTITPENCRSWICETGIYNK